MAIDTGLQGKPWYYGFGAGAVVAVVILAAVHYLLVTGVQEKIRSNEAQLEELSKKIAAGRAAERQLPQFRDQVKKLELELEKLRRILPSSRNTEEIIKKLKALVDQGNFILRKVQFPPIGEASEELVAEWPISVSVEGNYHDLAILFNRLSNFSRIVNVEQFTIEALPDQGQRTIRSDFVAKTFVYVEPKPETEATEEAGAPGGAQ
jgi:type IV pilus assembly protein PilO